MMASLNARVAKTTAAYQSVTHSTSSGRNMHAALDNLTSQHSSYMQQLSNLSYQIQQGKLGYGEAIAERREAAVKKVARVMCRLAEGEWRSDIEAVKRGGQKIGRLANAAIWVQPEMGPAVAATSSDDSREQSEIPSLGRSTSLRGPRAPSTATNDSSAPSTAPSSTARVPPLRQNPPSYRGDLLQQSTSNISTSSLPPVSPKTVPQTDNGGLRRPIPRYGSAPTVPLATEADEFGRTEMNASGTPRDATPQRQDSFVARMSAKYSSATMPGADSRADVQQVRRRAICRVLLELTRFRLTRIPILPTPAPTRASPSSPSGTPLLPMQPFLLSHSQTLPCLCPRLNRRQLDPLTVTRTACNTRRRATCLLRTRSSSKLPTRRRRSVSLRRGALAHTKRRNLFRLVSPTRPSPPAFPPGQPIRAARTGDTSLVTHTQSRSARVLVKVVNPRPRRRSEAQPRACRLIRVSSTPPTRRA